MRSTAIFLEEFNNWSFSIGFCRGLKADPAPGKVFEIDCLIEQPSNNKEWLCTVSQVVTVTDIPSWNHLRAVSRVCTSGRCMEGFRVFGYE